LSESETEKKEETTKLSATAERLLFENKEEELIRKLITALADFPGMAYYLLKHHIIYPPEERKNV